MNSGYEWKYLAFRKYLLIESASSLHVKNWLKWSKMIHSFWSCFFLNVWNIEDLVKQQLSCADTLCTQYQQCVGWFERFRPAVSADGWKQVIWLDHSLFYILTSKHVQFSSVRCVSSLKLSKNDLKLLQNMNISLNTVQSYFYCRRSKHCYFPWEASLLILDLSLVNVMFMLITLFNWAISACNSVLFSLHSSVYCMYLLWRDLRLK